MHVHEAEKKDAGSVGDRCSGLWRVISRCVVYTFAAFLAIVMTYYVVVCASSRPALMPSSGK